jgi:hypothetical protein
MRCSIDARGASRDQMFRRIVGQPLARALRRVGGSSHHAYTLETGCMLEEAVGRGRARGFKTHRWRTRGKQVTWCSTTAAHGSVHKAYIYEETCVPLCVEMDITSPPSPPPPSPSPPPPTPPPAPVGITDRRRSLLQWTSTLNIRMTTIDEQFPAVADPFFPYPYDELNVPPTSGLFFDSANEVCSTCNVTSNVLRQLPANFCFLPNEYEECVYTVCFQGETTVGTYETTDVRCVKIEVMNEVSSRQRGRGVNRRQRNADS